MKVVIFGGGSGLSQIMKGMVSFPWKITAVVSVSDDGRSTGALRKEFSIPAVGDITKVMMAMSQKSDKVKELFMYRFKKESSLKGHSIKNLIMTALLEMEGDFKHAIPILSDLLYINGDLLPVTEDNVDLIGITSEGKEIVGESEITKARSKIDYLKYDKKVSVNKDVIKKIKEADLIVFSAGSLITSIMPHIIIEEIQQVIKESKAKKMYICNIITQPGETDEFSVKDHVDMLEKYLGKNTIDVVIANNTKLPKKLRDKAAMEDKEEVKIDRERLKNAGIELIEDRVFCKTGDTIRHDPLKTSYLMFAYLMDKFNK